MSAEPSFIRVRDVLDQVLRDLAGGRGTLRDRVPQASQLLLRQLGPRDFPDREERAVFTRLHTAALEISLLGVCSDQCFGEDVLSAMLHDLIDLHERVEKRVLRETARYWSERPSGG